MKSKTCVLNTDAPNRYNMICPASELERGLRQRWNTGTPSNLAHDSTRLIGWMHPVSLFFEPQLTRLIGLFQTPQTAGDSELLSKARQSFLLDSHYERCKPFINTLEDRLGDNLSKDAELIDAGCAAFYDKDIVNRVFSKLISNADKHNLIKINDLKHLGGGIFEIGGLVIFAHRYYRRSFSLLNSINTHFFESIEKVVRQGIDVWIAIDQDIIGCPESYFPSIELAYWWGPNFSDDLASIPPGVKRGDATEFERIYMGVSATDFWWQSRKNEHILEVEELRDVPQNESVSHYGCRYLHCIVNEKNKCIEHIDGAIRSYSEGEMISRIDRKIQQVDRRADYTKLWRIDHNIDIKLWKRLVSDYFRDNHLVGEYLVTEDKEEFRPTTKKDIAKTFSQKQKYTGFGIDQNSGPRINLSYHMIRGNFQSNRDVVPIDTITTESAKLTVIDLWTVELKKILMKKGHSLFIPSDVSYVACEDLYINLPLISHKSLDDTSITINAITELLKWSIDNSLDRAISINVSYPLGDAGYDIQLSFYGHCTDLLEYLMSDKFELPESEDIISDWCDSLSNWINKYSKTDRPIPNDIIQPSGILWLKRQQVPKEIDIKYEYCKEEKRVKFYGKFPELYFDLGKSLVDEEMAIRFCSIIEEVICTSCGKSFFDCKCSVVLDGAGKKIKKCEPMGIFLTDKPA